jgi:hypothetical protein
MAPVNPPLAQRFTNAQQEFEHWQRCAEFWANEAFEARRYGGADNEATAKIFENGAKTAREMAEHYRLSIIGGK